MRNILSIILIAAIAVTSVMMLTACGDNKSEPTEATVAATQPTEATQPATQSTATAVANSITGTTTTNDGQSGYDPDSYAGIPMEKAQESALARSGAGAQIINCYEGAIPSGTQAGNEAWVVTVQEADGTQKTYYCGYLFCINAENQDAQGQENSEKYAGITMEKAYSLALARSGEGAQVIGCYQGTIDVGSQAGDEAWIVTVQEADGTQTTYYCGHPFCYTAEDLGY